MIDEKEINSIIRQYQQLGGQLQGERFIPWYGRAAHAIAERLREGHGGNTGWHVMVKHENDRWFAIGCVSEDDRAFYDTWYPEFDVILAIPDPETVPEFDGF